MTPIQIKELRLRLKWNVKMNAQDYFTESQVYEFKNDLRKLKLDRVKKEKKHITRNKKCNHVKFEVL